MAIIKPITVASTVFQWGMCVRYVRCQHPTNAADSLHVIHKIHTTYETAVIFTKFTFAFSTTSETRIIRTSFRE